jgi:hypothetical protein
VHPTRRALRVDFIDSMRTRRPNISQVDAGDEGDDGIVDLATRSMWDGGAYTFDPRTYKVTRV